MRVESMEAINTGVVALKANVRPVADAGVENNIDGLTQKPKEVKESRAVNESNKGENANVNAGKTSGKLTKAEKAELNVSEQAFRNNIEKINKMLVTENRSFEYSVHEKTKDIMVKVIDTETKEVIREIPPEKILDLVARLCELAGLFVDEKV